MQIDIINAPFEYKVLVVISLVEVFKYLFGTQNKKAVLVAIAIGVMIELGVAVGTVYPAALPWINRIFGGVVMGLAASGFYRITKNGITGIIETSAKAVASVPKQKAAKNDNT